MSIANWMYMNSDDSIRLSRKYALYQQFKEIHALSGKQKIEAMTLFADSDHWKHFFQFYNIQCPKNKTNQCTETK